MVPLFFWMGFSQYNCLYHENQTKGLGYADSKFWFTQY